MQSSWGARRHLPAPPETGHARPRREGDARSRRPEDGTDSPRDTRPPRARAHRSPDRSVRILAPSFSRCGTSGGSLPLSVHERGRREDPRLGRGGWGRGGARGPDVAAAPRAPPRARRPGRPTPGCAGDPEAAALKSPVSRQAGGGGGGGRAVLFSPGARDPEALSGGRHAAAAEQGVAREAAGRAVRTAHRPTRAHTSPLCDLGRATQPLCARGSSPSPGLKEDDAPG
ncbi:laforin-like [Canis lupus dingo]|uniref:laforin-like n=1 Tax=Canis lupus dingo TaxID=286419 RepID=UPI0020C36CF6|nr:laforin-like [Canis lupus dingo]